MTGIGADGSSCHLPRASESADARRLYQESMEAHVGPEEEVVESQNRLMTRSQSFTHDCVAFLR